MADPLLVFGAACQRVFRSTSELQLGQRGGSSNDMRT
jgi:hypothetical protein